MYKKVNTAFEHSTLTPNPTQSIPSNLSSPPVLPQPYNPKSQPTFPQSLQISPNKAKPPIRIRIRVPMASLKSDQVEQLEAIFKRFDLDSDGSLTQLELAALLRSLGVKPTGDQLHALLANMDSNGNGSIEFDELLTALGAEMADAQILINQEQMMEVFRSFDRDGNGYITPSELAGSMAKMGHPLSYRELVDMMREADTDGDGQISFAEFALIMGRSATEFFGL